MDGVGFHETGPLFKLSSLPVSIGLYGFCYSGHAVFPNIYSSLRNRNAYNKVLGIRCALNINHDLYIGSCLCRFMNMSKERRLSSLISFVACALIRSFILCTLLYSGMAVMGFTMFGEDTASQITLNLPKQFLASNIAVWTTVSPVLQRFVAFSS